jgi:hypothetical protein
MREAVRGNSWNLQRRGQDLTTKAYRIAPVIRRGSLEKPAGKRREKLERWFSGPEGPPALFAGRVLPFDEKAGFVWAGLIAEGRQPAEANDSVVVTDNEQDFASLRIVSPLRAAV